MIHKISREYREVNIVVELLNKRPDRAARCSRPALSGRPVGPDTTIRPLPTVATAQTWCPLTSQPEHRLTAGVANGL